jgi:hypothetical protein
MRQVLHERPDHARRQCSKTAIACFALTLSRTLEINSGTVPKRRERTTVGDLNTRPKAPQSTILNEAEEAAVIAFERHTCCRSTVASMRWRP